MTMKRCGRPPLGWFCKLPADHDGPCPIHPRFWAHPIWWLRMVLLVATVTLFAMTACSVGPTIAELQAGKRVATSTAASVIPTGPSASRSACADLYAQATIGRPAPGVIQCMTTDQQQSWAAVGIKSDGDFSTKAGGWSGMKNAQYVGRDQGNPVYDLSTAQLHMMLWVILDPSGHISDINFLRFQR